MARADDGNSGRTSRTYEAPFLSKHDRRPLASWRTMPALRHTSVFIETFQLQLRETLTYMFMYMTSGKIAVVSMEKVRNNANGDASARRHFLWMAGRRRGVCPRCIRFGIWFLRSSGLFAGCS